ncbi:hypothetical protein GCM10009665_46720 [Kitasatospora nipponensis]|uniref:Uncharacterized protein n=1 Tax=Kitasatospora nipponensis TaxID=258049 RepID=A0ABN1WIF0_9ACTN
MLPVPAVVPVVPVVPVAEAVACAVSVAVAVGVPGVPDGWDAMGESTSQRFGAA